MSSEEIKFAYRLRLTNLQYEIDSGDSKGAGLGLITVARNAKRPIEYSVFWDDSGAGPDDNHDDMLIKAVFTPRSVPEPATLGLFGLGLLGVWAGARRRRRKA